MYGQVLVTVREAFAVAPGLRSARVAVLRNDGPDAYGRPKISCILATKLDRAAFEQVQWATAHAGQIVNDISADLVHNPRGRSQGLSPIDLAGEPELAQLVAAVDVDELTGSGPGLAGPASEAYRPSAGGDDAAVTRVRDAPGLVDAAIPGEGGPVSAPARSSRLKQPVFLALLLGIGIPVVSCCGVGAVMAAMGGGKNLPAGPATSSFTTAPAPRLSSLASALPVATSSTTPTPTTAVAPVPAPTVPEPTTQAPPPPQTGVHPGAFCSPLYAFGYTSTGVLMQCKPSATDSAFRWRQA